MLSKAVEQCLYAKLNLSDEEYMNAYKRGRGIQNAKRHSAIEGAHAAKHGGLHALAGGAIGGLVGAAAGGAKGAILGGFGGMAIGGIHGTYYGTKKGKRIAEEGDKAFHEATEAHLKKYSKMSDKDRKEYRDNFHKRVRFEREMAQRKREADQKHQERVMMVNTVGSLGHGLLNRGLNKQREENRHKEHMDFNRRFYRSY
jgi:predicted lipid-binding transport protein (Tim44 family)